MTPDPKPTGRVKDRDAFAYARVREDACAACGRPPANAHHILPKDKGGDDVAENLTMLCGTGTWGCHGVMHGNPYTDHDGKRWQRAETSAAIGRHLLATRPDSIQYVLTRLGWSPGREWLRREYAISLPDDYDSPA